MSLPFSNVLNVNTKYRNYFTPQKRDTLNFILNLSLHTLIQKVGNSLCFSPKLYYTKEY